MAAGEEGRGGRGSGGCTVGLGLGLLGLLIGFRIYAFYCMIEFM